MRIHFRHTLRSLQGTFTLDVGEEFEEGGFVCVYGPSGSGKTTFLRLLAGLDLPSEGQIHVHEQCWLDTGIGVCVPTRQRDIGFVSQAYDLFPHMSVRKNLEFACGDVAPTSREWIDELLESAGLTDFQHVMPETLSGGQQQRLALLRAIARKPKLLLLDEPLSAIDGAMRSILRMMLRQWHATLQMTVVMVTHDLGEVFALASHVIVVEAGQVVRRGTAQQVFLQQRKSGQIEIQAQILAMRREDVVVIASVLVGREIIDVIIMPDEASLLSVGSYVALGLKSFSPSIRVHETG